MSGRLAHFKKFFFPHPVSAFMASVLQKYLPVLLVRPCLHFAKYCCSRLIFSHLSSLSEPQLVTPASYRSIFPEIPAPFSPSSGSWTLGCGSTLREEPGHHAQSVNKRERYFSFSGRRKTRGQPFWTRDKNNNEGGGREGLYLELMINVLRTAWRNSSIPLPCPSPS